MTIRTVFNDFRKRFSFKVYEKKTEVGKDGKFIVEVNHRFNSLFYVGARYSIESEVLEKCEKFGYSIHGEVMQVCEVFSLDWDTPVYMNKLIETIIDEANERQLDGITVTLELGKKRCATLLSYLRKYEFSEVTETKNGLSAKMKF